MLQCVARGGPRRSLTLPEKRPESPRYIFCLFLWLGNRRLASGTVVTLAKGDGQLAPENASSDDIKYFGGGVHCFIRGGRGGSSFDTGNAELFRTADEDLT